MRDDDEQIARHIAEHGVTKLPPRVPRGAPGQSRWNPGAQGWLEANDPDYHHRKRAKARARQRARARAKRNPQRVAHYQAALRANVRP